MSRINPNIRHILQKEDFIIKPLDYYLDGMLTRKDPFVLSESITLLESDAPEHQLLAREILLHAYSHRVESQRIGITGPPGVGKSSFIESFMSSQVNEDDRIAILTIDPSSANALGSILGDKTRMPELAKKQTVFIRPSPSRSFLGGTARYTLEAIMMCEAAGYNKIVIETVGVGQSESDISHLADLVILLISPGGGDELQGIKKGILEVVDLMIVHKADGVLNQSAQQTLKDYSLGGHLLGDKVKIHSYSSLSKEGKEAIEHSLQAIIRDKKRGNHWVLNRHKQELLWFELSVARMLYDRIAKELKSNPTFSSVYRDIEAKPEQLMQQYVKVLTELNLQLKWR